MYNQSVSAAAMEKALGAMWQRIQLIGHNLANEDTPNFKAKRLSFETELQRELNKINHTPGTTRQQEVQRIQDVTMSVYDEPGLEARADGNNVNADNEYIELARVQIQYQALQQKISGHYSLLRYAITGGR